LQTPGAARLRALIDDGLCFGHLAVVQGVVWRALGLSEDAASVASAYTTASGLIAAAVRLGCVGAIEAQAILAGTLATVEEVATPVPVGAAIESFTPWLDVAASRQARAHLRLFAS
jgi:urease accessory protein